MKKILGALVISVLTATLLAACGGETDHNDADIAFTQGMIPHHAQAVVMADQALKTSRNADVRALATQVKSAQDPEIETMKTWLDDWGADASGHDGMDHGGEGDGMMTDAEMKALDGASGRSFDAVWLTLMIKHHEGAVAMSETELKDGKSSKATKLARQIIDAQRAEITTMKGLLKK